MFLVVSDEGGGGNRVSEEQIKDYLRHTVGLEAPQPEWGLPKGWGDYLAGRRRAGPWRGVPAGLTSLLQPHRG